MTTVPRRQMTTLLATALSGVALAGCGSSSVSPAAPTTAPSAAVTPAYRSKIRRIARTRCHGMGAAALARLLHVKRMRTAVADAYARTWPPSVRDAARTGCLRGLG